MRNENLQAYFDEARILRLFFLELLVALLIIADAFVYIVLSEYIAVFLLLAAAGVTALPGIYVIYNSIQNTLSAVRARVRMGRYPRLEYASLAGLLLSGVLLVLPGFFSDIVGILLYILPVRLAVGLLICSRLEAPLTNTYEHLKLEEYASLKTHVGESEAETTGAESHPNGEAAESQANDETLRQEPS